jgi:hypothetical protein
MHTCRPARLRAIFPAILLALWLLPGVATAETAREAVVRLQLEARAAYQAKDYHGFLEKSARAL